MSLIDNYNVKVIIKKLFLTKTDSSMKTNGWYCSECLAILWSMLYLHLDSKFWLEYHYIIIQIVSKNKIISFKLRWIIPFLCISIFYSPWCFFFWVHVMCKLVLLCFFLLYTCCTHRLCWEAVPIGAKNRSCRG